MSLLGVSLGLVVAGAGLAGPTSPARVIKVDRVALLVRHRVFHDFVEADTVRLKQDFQVGDTPFTARVTDFLPDFSLDLKKHKYFTRSNELRNPAFRIVVREKGVPRDTSWAFMNMPPHFARNSLLAFQILRIDFPDRPSIVAGDTTANHPAGAPKGGKP